MTIPFLFIFHLLRQPVYQCVFFLLITVLFVPFLRRKTANAVWNLAGIFYIGFICTNGVFLFFDDGVWSYFFISLACSLGYILVAGMSVSLLVSALKISGSGESAMIFITIIYHPLVLLAMILLEWISSSS
ncbi:MAG: hypothetical protein ABI477_22630 [Chryseolinea sp.]